jgi:hypothetical protein
MEKGDIAPYVTPQLAVMFEHVLAAEPSGVHALAAATRLRARKYEKYLSYWKPNELQVKHVIDTIGRKNIGVVVYTLFENELSDEVEKWLVRRNISTTVTAYNSIYELASDQKFFPGIKQIFVGNQDHARIIGIKATVITANTGWSL